MPEYRIANCLRKPIPGIREIEIWKREDRANYKGLQVCGSVWHCPVCAARISEFRREELVAANRNWLGQGGSILHLIQTVPHHLGQSLKLVLEGFQGARMIMHGRTRWKTWKKKVGLAGTVRTLEVTYGFENGWHVHAHEELFIQPGYQPDPLEVQVAVFGMWKDACESVGLGQPTFRRGIQVQDGAFAAKYMSKWGIESELTKAHVKHAKGDNFGPFDMLEEYSQGRRKEEFADLFREYAKAFKGKRQLVWSDGMRALVGIGKEEADFDLAKKIEDDAVLLGSLDRFQWSQVERAEKRGELLIIAGSEGWPGVKRFIRELISYE